MRGTESKQGGLVSVEVLERRNISNISGTFDPIGHIYFNAANSCNRYGNYTEVNPLYNSCKFFIKY